MNDLPVLPGYKKNALGKVVPDGYPKWAKDNTSTVPNDPANQINRAKGNPQKAAPGVTFNHNSTTTINDGTTDVVVSHLRTQNELKNTPNFGGQPEKQHYPPCINPTCKSFGKSHPNCLCYAGPGGSSLEQGHFAHGGKVCSGPHHESCEFFADGGQAESQQRFLNDPQASLDAVGMSQGLSHLLTNVGHNGRSETPHKYLEEYHDHAKRGHKLFESHVSKLLSKEKLDLHHNPEARENLKDHLSKVQERPSEMIETGGNLGQALPSHASALGYKAAQATNYLNSIKPQSSQGAPLDRVQKPSPAVENQYHRQIDIANNPSLVLQHVKNGTVQPSDLQTLDAIYPSLAKSMRSKAFERLVEAKTKGVKIPYHQRQGLSMLLGQPLDFSQSVAGMQAIIKANSPMASQTNEGKPQKANAKAVEQSDKVAEELATPIQKRLMGKS